jgi:hypothetical protein
MSATFMTQPRGDEHTKPPEEQDEELDGGAYIGNRPELSSETIPGGVREDDERVAAHDTQSSGEGKLEDRVQGRDDEWPAGHREPETPNDR